MSLSFVIARLIERANDIGIAEQVGDLVFAEHVARAARDSGVEAPRGIERDNRQSFVERAPGQRVGFLTLVPVNRVKTQHVVAFVGVIRGGTTPCSATSPSRRSAAILEHDIAGERDRERRVGSRRFGREQHALDAGTAAIVAEQRRVIAVVRQNAHSPMRALLAESQHTDRGPVLHIQPARVGAKWLPLVVGLLGRIDEARRLPEREATRHVDLSDELQPCRDIECAA